MFGQFLGINCIVKKYRFTIVKKLKTQKNEFNNSMASRSDFAWHS